MTLSTPRSRSRRLRCWLGLTLSMLIGWQGVWAAAAINLDLPAAPATAESAQSVMPCHASPADPGEAADSCSGEIGCEHCASALCRLACAAGHGLHSHQAPLLHCSLPAASPAASVTKRHPDLRAAPLLRPPIA